MTQLATPQTIIKIGEKLRQGEWSPDSSNNTVYKASLRGSKFCYIVTDDPNLVLGSSVNMSDYDLNPVASFMVFKKNGLGSAFSASAGASNGAINDEDDKNKGYQPDKLKSSDEIWDVTRSLCR